MNDEDISEDGHWKWDGNDWVPNEPPAPPIKRVILQNPMLENTTAEDSFNFRTISRIAGVVFLLLSASVYFVFYMGEDETDGVGVYFEWHYMCSSDCDEVWIEVENHHGVVYSGYRLINDDDWGTPIRDITFIWEGEIYSMRGIVQRESSERSLVAIIGSISTKGFDRDDACVIFDDNDYDYYATAGDIGFYVIETLRNNDC